ncbi:TonB-dependent receptor plug domain-containing protein [Pelagicoccus sp. SDUM812003]|uniref:TonB-dependent receptor plug domain-containing protein n=1 Tax=Pelagicoccus sp. SDUM812003 TaxID=3041267 RepID=UPI00280E2F3C|nr:TonB-dependent receptor plug domain-containing protein [Pelagicoccus sp. SDUM812003]MDQ8203497.1 TonB-dependent receptor plug domain-containing protein [Pelagicoccus sp. SDUM812003]
MRYLEPRRRSWRGLCGLALLIAPLCWGQSDDVDEEEVFELSPFEVTADEREGYQAADTLAGNRLNTKLRDIGNAVSVVTTQFLDDTGATDNQTLLQYTVGTEVGGTQGTFAGVGDGALLDESSNFINPNQNTRVRGLTAADNTRNFFTSEIPWDSYNIDRVELQRGPNSILFGQGSPAGLVNVGLQGASFEDEGEVEMRFDEHGSARYVLNYNKQILEDELAIRVAALYNDQKYQQDPAFSRDERIYAALRWDPSFLNGDNVRTMFKANFEDGEVRSNNPRTLPPIDRISPWFDTGTYNGTYISDGNILVDGELVPVSKGDTRVYNALNRATFNPHQLQQDNVAFPNHGQGRPGINGGPFSGAFNPDYNPRLGNFANSFGGPMHFYGSDGGAPDIWSLEIRQTGGINSAGEVDGGIGGYDFHRAMGIATESAFARNAGLPFGEFGVYKNNSITDSSIFDYYNNLIDGPNKNEWQNFESLNLSFSQTYLNDMVGFDLSYYKQDYDNGQVSLLSGSQQAIYIDIMKVYPDGDTNTWTPGEIPFDNGTPNPNVGRPFVADRSQFGNNSHVSEREAFRATPFVKYDFVKGDGGNWFTNFLGKGTFTGLYSDETIEREDRSWQQYAILDQSFIEFADFAGGLTDFTTDFLAPTPVIYLGDSLINSSSAAGANIPRVMQKAVLPRNATISIFDSTWAGGDIDPAAEWINNAYLPPELEYPDYNPVDPNNLTEAEMELWPDRRLSTQAENPANYVGFREVPYTLTAAEDSAANRELLGRSARLDKRETKSEALIWQGHLWHESIVGTYGWRKDTTKSWGFSQTNSNHTGPDTLGHLNFDPSYYRLPDENDTELTVQSRAYSVVAHLDNMPFLRETFADLPFRLSLFYNNSTNFQPESARVDIYGQAIAPPSGETIDKGILIQSRDGRYSFKANSYKTEVTNATSTALSDEGFIGASQAWGANWANQYEYDMSIDNFSHIVTHVARNRPAGAAVPPNYSEDRLLDTVDVWNDGQGNDINGNPVDGGRGSLYNYGLAPGETAADAAAREAAAVSAWRAWQAQVDPRFYEAWQIDLDAPFRLDNPSRIDAVRPQNFSITEDSVSEGYEFEFALRPVDNWNIMINAAKTKATRNNIGGVYLSEFINSYQDALRNTAAGDLRIWWGGAGNETSLFQWNSNVGSEWTARKLQEGTNAPELREWRWNIISNYEFSDGRFKGLSVGGGLRWQDSVIIGYRPIPGETDAEISFDLGNPYTGPTETNLDLWVGYGRPINDWLDWRIQVNVRNAFQDNDLIPITTQPDGTPAGYRIAPAETWSIRNTFSF